MARLPDADQGRFSVPRLDSGCAHRARPGAIPRLGAAHSGAQRARDPGMAELLLQESDERSRPVSGTRFVHPVDEAEEHVAPSARGRTDHASGTRVLRLIRPGRRGEYARLAIARFPFTMVTPVVLTASIRVAMLRF